MSNESCSPSCKKPELYTRIQVQIAPSAKRYQERTSKNKMKPQSLKRIEERTGKPLNKCERMSWIWPHVSKHNSLYNFQRVKIGQVTSNSWPLPSPSYPWRALARAPTTRPSRPPSPPLPLRRRARDHRVPRSDAPRRRCAASRGPGDPPTSWDEPRNVSKRLESTLRDSASETGNISNFETTHWIQLENIAFCREKQRKIMENLYAGHCSWWLLANGKPRNSGQDFLRMDWTWDYVLLFLQVKLNSTFSNI